MPSRDEEKPPDPQWLLWSRRLQAIAQDGLTYTRDGYDLGRYEQIRELAAEILAAHSTGTLDEVPSSNVDTDEVRFFGDNELPELSITRVTPAQVSRFFEQHRDPGLPTYFD